MEYTYKALVECRSLFPAMAAIVSKVEAAKERIDLDLLASLETYAKRGDSVALAYDGETLVGFTAVSHANHWIKGPYWISFRIWCGTNGLDLADAGCPHMVYLEPDYWSGGATEALVNAATAGAGFKDYVYHTTPSVEMSDWWEAMPYITRAPFFSPNGTPVLIEAKVS